MCPYLRPSCQQNIPLTEHCAFAKKPFNYFRIFNGEEQEVEVFDKMNPPFFFLNCKLTKCDIEDGSTVDEPLFVPVIQKGGKYFLFGGQNKCRLYKIDDPHWLFFTIEGHQRLVALLTALYKGQYITVLFNRFHDHRPRRLLCVPEQLSKGSYPSVHWNELR